MSISRTEGFYLWRCLPDGKIVKVGALALKQLANKRITNIQFRYEQSYLDTDEAFPLDPIHTPLTNNLQHYDTAGHQLPGFIDDCLPDDWGRRIVAARLGVRHVDTLTLMNNLDGAAMGAVKITPASQKELLFWQGGVDYYSITKVAEAVWQGDMKALVNADESLPLILTGGTRTGGARPKLLVSDEGKQYLVKFNRSQDSFNMAAVEWACLQVAAAAGLKVAKAKLDTLGTRSCLKVKRFDISTNGGRYHLLTCNALLKDNHTQDDAHQGRYEDIADLIRRYCISPISDLEQLLPNLA